MNDPYKILNIPPTATDDEVKKAYRELARKYHPDNYHDSPVADLAQEKMKVINEAYEQIQKQRRNASAGASQGGYGNYGRYGSYSYAGSSDPAMQQVRLAINRGDLNTAERLLTAVSEHTAEWNFLMGVVVSRRGWLDEAKRYFETAVSMDPNNPEYQSALNALSGGGYRPAGFGNFSTASFDSTGCCRYCAAMACINALCGGGFYCLPCYF